MSNESFKNENNSVSSADRMGNFFKKRKDLLTKRDSDAVKSLNDRGTQVNPYANSLIKKQKTTIIAVR